ncbi:hypothetical protein GCM10009087_01460 [Sphingomonas oligophenolica]|uniref:Class IIb bacteriocin, lactobin A/cerein 7B family n=1 Tax=Sphingomonas oligophenolica TaxID=301154 RepID=A0ABU9Y148_9SPHN
MYAPTVLDINFSNSHVISNGDVNLIADLTFDEIDFVDGGMSNEMKQGLEILGLGILVGAAVGLGVGAVFVAVALAASS